MLGFIFSISITNFFNLVSKSVFFIRLLASGILFSTAVNAELVAKPIILGILPSISVTLVLKAVFLAKLLISGIFLSILLILSSKSDPSLSYLVFLTKFVV